MSGTLAIATPESHARERRALAGLALGLAALGLLFRHEIASAVHVWSVSTAYNHCFLIVPIAGFLAWERRARLAATPVRPMPALALAALPLGFAWLVAERLGIMEGRQLLAMAFVQLLVMTVGGWRMWRSFAAPLLYLFFLVPFGAFITPQLQSFTAHFTTTGLDLIGIPNYSDGNTIEIPQGVFYVAEACAGLRFLIASVAFGALYALMMYRSPGRRLAFIAISIVVPIIANGFRALGIVALGHALGSAQAAATDHVLYGWIFFSLVILALTVLGLPFRQDTMAPATRDFSRDVPRRPPGNPIAAALAVVALAALAPAAAYGLSARRPMLAAIPAPPVEGCVTRALAALATFEVDCDGQRSIVDVTVFPPRAGASAVLEARRAATREIEAEDVTTTPLPDPAGSAAWRLVQTREPFGARADSLWLGGHAAGGGLALRLTLAKASLLGAADAPVLITVTPAIDWAAEGEAGLAHARLSVEQFLRASPGLPDYARALSRAAAGG